MTATISTPLITIIIVLTLFFVIVSLLGFLSAVRPAQIASDTTPQDFGIPFEEVSFTTSDNLKLKGWFIPHANPDTAKTIICLHGYPADKGNIFPAVIFLKERYNLFLFDFRHLGQSEGNISTIGLKETKDLSAALTYLKQQGIDKVGVWGFSMGGAVAMMTAPLSSEIEAIVSDSSYARLDLLAPDLFRFPLLKYPLGWLTTVWVRIFLGVDVKAQSPQVAAQRINIPVLLIHSKTDEVIPFNHAQRLQKALEHNQRAGFWFQDNLIHGQVGPEYQEKVRSFFEEHL